MGPSGVSTENLQWEGRENLTKPPIEVPAVDVSIDSSSQSENLTKPPIEVPAVDVSVDSSSQPDSLEGNWGFVSGTITSFS